MSEKSRRLLFWILCVLAQLVGGAILLLAAIGSLHLIICVGEISK